MEFLYVKAFHIIFVVTWFAGMFYIVRLFIYQREANDKDEEERRILLPQFTIMVHRLHYAICMPSAIITLLLGSRIWMLYGFTPNWLVVKLCFVVFLYLYQFSLHVLVKKHSGGIFPFTSFQLRLWNELATIFLITIIMLVVVKTYLSPVVGVIVIIGIAVTLAIAVKWYQRIRNRQA